IASLPVTSGSSPFRRPVCSPGRRRGLRRLGRSWSTLSCERLATSAWLRRHSRSAGQRYMSFYGDIASVRRTSDQPLAQREGGPSTREPGRTRLRYELELSATSL